MLLLGDSPPPERGARSSAPAPATIPATPSTPGELPVIADGISDLAPDRVDLSTLSPEKRQEFLKFWTQLTVCTCYRSVVEDCI